MALEAAVRECQARTRQYAKRQMTWFRAEPHVHWLTGFGTEPAIRQHAIALARAFLKPDRLRNGTR